MAAPIITGSIEASDFTPLTPQDGGWIPVAGDADARVHTLCDTGEVWSGVALVEPCTFDYPAAHAGSILLLDGSATISSDGHTGDVSAGDAIYLRPGTTSTWVVHTPVREFFVVLTGGHEAS